MIINNISQKEITQEIKELLLLADPDYSRIEDYLNESEIFILKQKKNIIGVLVLKHKKRLFTEIMNIAIREEYRRKGYGKRLIEESEKIAKSKGNKYLEIGTGNSSIGQIRLYQRCGFRIDRIIKNYFRNYDKEIIENGITCMDMIKLKKTL